MSEEITRIRQVYETRYRPVPGDYTYIWHPRNAVSVTYRQARERAIIQLVAHHGLALEDAQILDIGCGNGDFMRFLAALGVPPNQLFGVDLMEYRIESARKLSPPDMHFVVQDAQRLPFETGAFDLVSQLVVFSSVLDSDVRHWMATEMDRVLKPGGILLWYDLKNRQAPSSHLQGVDQRQLAGLFPGYAFLARRSLHHRWISRLAPRSWLLCELIDRLPGLSHTHLLALLKKP